MTDTITSDELIEPRLRERIAAYTRVLDGPARIRITAAHLESARNELRDAADLIARLSADKARMPVAKRRDRRNGQYTFDGDWARLCVCGHTFGVHGGEAPHDCLAGTNCLNDPQPGVFCDCQKFRPAKPHRSALQNASTTP